MSAEHMDTHDKVTFGFWTYVMTEVIMFAALIATYVVLRNSTYGGPGIQQINNLSYAFIQTLLVLTAAFAFRVGLASYCMEKKGKEIAWLLISMAFAVAFCYTQYHQFDVLMSLGITYQGSAFLSAFYSVLAIFALHVAVAILWTIVILIQLLMKSFEGMMKTRLVCLGLFWSFLSLIWLVIFTVVYLMGAV